jgi:hemerythrin-like domain-containing protein
MAIDAGEMVLVHRVFRRAFDELPALITGTAVGDIRRARAVADQLNLVIQVLHHHHAAEDEMLWPKLSARVPLAANRIHQLEEQHAVIAAMVDSVQRARLDWVRAARPDTAVRLVDVVINLGYAVGEHLDDEERDAVPLIEKHITEDEWQAMLKRGAAFLTPRTVRQALVFGGLVLEGAGSPAERVRFLAGVPAGPRILVRLFAARTLAAQRKRMGAEVNGSPS